MRLSWRASAYSRCPSWSSVRFKVDENLPTDVAVLLRQAGYEADTVS